jgi:hypothetical protein
MEFGDIQGQPPSATTGLAKLVQDRFTWCRNLRFLQQEKWLSAKMNFDGIDYYGSDESANQSGIFLNFTQMKSMSAYSQIMNVMSGVDGYPWYIKPTPQPELIKLGYKSVAEAEKIPNLPEYLKQNIVKANVACDGMQVKIKDNLSETYWEEKFSRGVLDLVVLGTMIVKGPFSSSPSKKKWVLVDQENQEELPMNQMGQEQSNMQGLGAQQTGASEKVYKLVSDAEEDPRPDLEIVSPFEFYPDPAAVDIKDALWAIHRHVMNKAQLLELANVPGFNVEEINKAVEANPKGNWTAETWESRVFALNQRQTPMARGDRYVVLEHWGYVGGLELQSAGVEMPKDFDKNKQYMACLWTVGEYCIKIAMSSFEVPYIPFVVCPYEKVLYSIWGRGLPEKMRDPQDIVNAAARAMVDNMGIAAGPQVIYDTSRMINGFKFEGIKPWGVWPLKTLEGITAPPVTFVPVPSILGDLKVLQDNFKMFIQEVTSMPDMTGGYAGSASGQHNRTASGMSMLFNAANSYIKGVLLNLDNNITKPIVRRLYDWNMQYSSNMEIKGDFSIEAGGVARMISNEGREASIAELIQLMQDPDYKPYINKENILKEWIRIRGFNSTDIINSDGQAQQIKQQMQQEAAAMAQAQNVPTLRAETSRPDALLEMLQNTDPASPIYPAIYEEVALSQDAMTPSMKAAIDLIKMQLLSGISEEQEASLNQLATKASPEPKDFQQAGGYPQTSPQPMEQQGEQQQMGQPGAPQQMQQEGIPGQPPTTQEPEGEMSPEIQEILKKMNSGL